MRTKVKVCGITRLADALEALNAGADALGFVFAPSPRKVSPSLAGEIVAALPPFVRTFGVTVDARAEELHAIVTEARVDMLQFHGSESPDACRTQARPVIKRIPVVPGDDTAALIERAAPYAGTPLLLDPGRGEGRPFPFELAAALPRPIVIAGGLDAGNVAAAIRAARPYGIDVCSGVEGSPGIKCPDRLRALIRAVRSEDARHAA